MECFKDLKVDYSMDKSKMIAALFHLKKVFDTNNIFFWLGAGTLLGAVREGKIIDWDNDIDICIWNVDLCKLPILRNELNNSDFELYVIPIHIFPFSFGHYGLRTRKDKKHVLCIFSCFVSNDNIVWMRVLPLVGNVLRHLHLIKTNMLCGFVWTFVLMFRLYKVQSVRYPVILFGNLN